MSNHICNSCSKELKRERYRGNYDFSEINNLPRSYRINDFKRTYNNSFLYLTYLFRNGKILINNNSKMINNDNHKKEKIIIKERNIIKKANNENNLYNNRTDPYKEACQLYDFLEKNKKKFASNEKFHKTFSGFQNLLGSNKKVDSKEKKKINFYNTIVREGFFGRKNKENIPNFFPSISVSQNEYASKSEKERHEKVLDELGKLSFYLDTNPNNKIDIIKDFLIKFHITDFENYTEEQLLNIEKLIHDKNFLIEPYKDIKSMIKDALNKCKNNNNGTKKIIKKHYYISPNIPERIEKKPKPPPKEINIYENMDLERQKKFFLQNINFNDYNKIYKEMEPEIKCITENRNYKSPSKLNNNNKFNFITSFKNELIKSKTLLSNERSTRTKTLEDNSTLNNKSNNIYSVEDITDRLYYRQIWKPLEIDEIKRSKKLTEYVAFNKARNRMFENKLRILYEN